MVQDHPYFIVGEWWGFPSLQGFGSIPLAACEEEFEILYLDTIVSLKASYSVLEI